MVHYIDKDALVAEIDKRLHANGAFDEVGDEAWAEDVGMYNAYKSVLSFINTLETKEVDLEKELEYNDYINFFKKYPNYNSIDWGFDECWVFANYFFKLGLNTQKGEEV